MLGQSTIGSYHSIEFLSNAGHFSVVFLARRGPGNGKAVLKFFVDPSSDPYRHLAFVREGNLLWGALRGEDRFVQLLDAPATLDVPVPLPTGGSITLRFPYLAFQWMNGGDAESLVASPLKGHQDLIRRLDCFKEMVRAVARLHFKNCFHRDLKPGNFLFENAPNGRLVRLGDFGTVRFADGTPALLSEYTGPVGDLRYSAPELYSGVDIPQHWYRAADVYSLGAILFELLTQQQIIAWTFGSVQRALDFHQCMTTIQPTQRLQRYDAFLDSHGHSAPKLRAVTRAIPKCVAPRLDELVAVLTDFDYRNRTIDLGQVIRSLDICKLVLANEARQAERRQLRRVAQGAP